MITRALRQAWRADARVHRSILDALDAADGLRETARWFAYPTVAGDTFLVDSSDVNALRAALAAYDALVEPAP